LADTRDQAPNRKVKPHIWHRRLGMGCRGKQADDHHRQNERRAIDHETPSSTSPALTMRILDWHQESKRKVFFSEEKKQKTFATLGIR
jgi:hypothetical protein